MSVCVWQNSDSGQKSNCWKQLWAHIWCVCALQTFTWIKYAISLKADAYAPRLISRSACVPTHTMSVCRLCSIKIRRNNLILSFHKTTSKSHGKLFIAVHSIQCIKSLYESSERVYEKCFGLIKWIMRNKYRNKNELSLTIRHSDKFITLNCANNLIHVTTVFCALCHAIVSSVHSLEQWLSSHERSIKWFRIWKSERKGKRMMKKINYYRKYT